jgi:DnaA family protein
VKQLLLDLIPPPRPSLENFVAARNAEALAALQGARDRNYAAKTIYLWGPSGSGKTHLANALLESAGWLTLDAAVRAADGGRDGRVAIDDVQALADEARQRLFNLINLQASGSGMLVATAICTPRDLAMRRDLASRLGSGLVFQLQPLSDTEKAAALRAHARSRGFELREDVLAYLLRHARRDMPSLMQFLDALDRHSIETGREITVPLVKDLTQPTLGLTP